MPMPKVREEAVFEARRLNGLDAKRGAIELDEEGAVIDDLEQRRRRWRRWCGLSKVITMCSPEEGVPSEGKMARPASLDNCENLIEMLLRRKRLSLPNRARVDSQRLLELAYPATLPAAATSSHAVTWLSVGSQLARHEYWSAGRQTAATCSNSHGEMVDEYARTVAARTG